MSIIPKLATSLNRRDEVPNQELAAEVVKRGDTTAVSELVENLANKNKGIRNDCIKVLYEIGYVEPKLIAGHVSAFLSLLTSKDNRLQWGAMYALCCVVKEKPTEIFAALPKIIDAADKGSVITRDGCVNILISLAAIGKYAPEAFPLLLKQMLTCPTNQLPMYAENAIPVVNNMNSDAFVYLLSSRLDEIEKESKRKRVEKVIKKMSK
jgi:HEAT repeat protein